ncbi:MAG: hypothetical protein R3Y33_05055 [Clostridia bacterium]
MASFTENYLLKKPSETDFYNIDDFNDNSDIIDEELVKRLEIPDSFVSGNIPQFNSSGNVVDSGKSISAFLSSTATYSTLGAEKSGEAQKVQDNLTSHVNGSNLHLTDEIVAKLAKVITSDEIVISSVQPEAIDGTVWIKIE